MHRTHPGQMSESKTTLRQKCIILGNPGVGKTSVVQMFHSDGSQYPKNYSMTIQCEIVGKDVNIPDSDKTVEMYLYDTGGHEIFTEYVPRYCEGAATFAVVYDVSNADSFAAVSKWLQIAKKAKNGKAMHGVLIANKVDVPPSRRQVSRHQGEDFARANKLSYFEVSAAENNGVDAPFYYMANWFYEHYQATVKVFTKVSESSK